MASDGENMTREELKAINPNGILPGDWSVSNWLTTRDQLILTANNYYSQMALIAQYGYMLRMDGSIWEDSAIDPVRGLV